MILDTNALKRVDVQSREQCFVHVAFPNVFIDRGKDRATSRARYCSNYQQDEQFRAFGVASLGLTGITTEEYYSLSHSPPKALTRCFTGFNSQDTFLHFALLY